MGDVSQLPGSRPSARNPAASDLRKHCKDASCHSLMAVPLYQSTRKILCWKLKPAQTTPAECRHSALFSAAWRTLPWPV